MSSHLGDDSKKPRHSHRPSHAGKRSSRMPDAGGRLSTAIDVPPIQISRHSYQLPASDKKENTTNSKRVSTLVTPGGEGADRRASHRRSKRVDGPSSAESATNSSVVRPSTGGDRRASHRRSKRVDTKSESETGKGGATLTIPGGTENRRASHRKSKRNDAASTSEAESASKRQSHRQSRRVDSVKNTASIGALDKPGDTAGGSRRASHRKSKRVDAAESDAGGSNLSLPGRASTRRTSKRVVDGGAATSESEATTSKRRKSRADRVSSSKSDDARREARKSRRASSQPPKNAGSSDGGEKQHRKSRKSHMPTIPEAFSGTSGARRKSSLAPSLALADGAASQRQAKRRSRTVSMSLPDGTTVVPSSSRKSFARAPESNNRLSRVESNNNDGRKSRERSASKSERRRSKMPDADRSQRKSMRQSKIARDAALEAAKNDGGDTTKRSTSAPPTDVDDDKKRRASRRASRRKSRKSVMKSATGNAATLSSSLTSLSASSNAPTTATDGSTTAGGMTTDDTYNSETQSTTKRRKTTLTQPKLTRSAMGELLADVYTIFTELGFHIDPTPMLNAQNADVLVSVLEQHIGDVRESSGEAETKVAYLQVQKQNMVARIDEMEDNVVQLKQGVKSCATLLDRKRQRLKEFGTERDRIEQVVRDAKYEAEIVYHEKSRKLKQAGRECKKKYEQQNAALKTAQEDVRGVRQVAYHDSSKAALCDKRLADANDERVELEQRVDALRLQFDSEQTMAKTLCDEMRSTYEQLKAAHDEVRRRSAGKERRASKTANLFKAKLEQLRTEEDNNWNEAACHEKQLQNAYDGFDKSFQRARMHLQAEMLAWYGKEVGSAARDKYVVPLQTNIMHTLQQEQLKTTKKRRPSAGAPTPLPEQVSIFRRTADNDGRNTGRRQATRSFISPDAANRILCAQGDSPFDNIQWTPQQQSEAKQAANCLDDGARRAAIQKAKINDDSLCPNIAKRTANSPPTLNYFTSTPKWNPAANFIHSDKTKQLNGSSFSPPPLKFIAPRIPETSLPHADVQRRASPTALLNAKTGNGTSASYQTGSNPRQWNEVANQADQIIEFMRSRRAKLDA